MEYHINIPDLEPMYQQVLSFVKEKQGEKDYIDTQRKDCDKMYFYAYAEDYTISPEMYEGLIVGIRVNNDMVEILGTTNYINTRLRFEDKDFKEASNNYNKNYLFTDDWELCWQPIRGNDIIHFIPTLFSIAESIEQY